MPDLTGIIEDTATEGVAKAAVDGRSAESIPLPDLIEADRYLKSLAAVDEPSATGGPKSGWRGVRMGRGIPPGSGPQ